MKEQTQARIQNVCQILHRLGISHIIWTQREKSVHEHRTIVGNGKPLQEVARKCRNSMHKTVFMGYK